MLNLPDPEQYPYYDIRFAEYLYGIMRQLLPALDAAAKLGASYAVNPLSDLAGVEILAVDFSLIALQFACAGDPAGLAECQPLQDIIALIAGHTSKLLPDLYQIAGLLAETRSGPEPYTTGLLALYDRLNGTDYHNVARAMFFRFGGVLAMVDRQIKPADNQALHQIRATLYPAEPEPASAPRYYDDDDYYYPAPRRRRRARSRPRRPSKN